MNIKNGSAVLISSAINIGYLTGFFGFSDQEREAYLFLTAENRYILTDSRYTEAVSEQISGFKLVEISGKYPIEQILKDICLQEKIDKIDIEDSSLVVEEYRKFSQICPLGEFKGIDRQTKTEAEVKKIKQACSLGDTALRYLLTKIKPSSTEKELSSLFEIFLLKNGAKPSFPTIVAFAENASEPHHLPTDKKLGPPMGQFLLVDSGVKLANYSSDMTRTGFWGKPDTQKLKIYQAVLDAQSKSAEFLDKKIKNGEEVTGSEVDKVARDFIEQQNLPPYSHGLGHGIGLEVHEPPRLSPKGDQLLKEGMVFSIEPGIYLPGLGGVRIEDLFVIEKNGLKQLTQSPKELILASWLW